MTTGVSSACPQCGAPLRFGGRDSLAVRCGYCRAAVARTGADLALLGRVPDLVAVDTRLALGATGKAGAEPFTILGRLQLSRGDATWNEWYAAFRDGFGWVAEAQGRLFVTRRVSNLTSLPRHRALRPGATVRVSGVGEVTLDEVARARLASFEGELPFRPELGGTYAYADGSGPDGAFVTLDYGTGDDDPDVFAGREAPWGSVTLPGGAAPAAGAEPAAALSCPRCGAPIALARPDEARTTTCASCRAVLDVSQGALRFVAELERRPTTVLPLGAKGTLRGEAVEVLGWIARSSEIEGTRYAWDEFLLHGAGGYRWLSVHAGHWLLLHAIAAGAVTRGPGPDVIHERRRYRHFQGAVARTDALQGEFYWEVRVGEEVFTDDYVSPPRLLSAERERREVSWTSGEHLGGDEVWSAFRLPGRPLPPSGVGPAQPNPWGPRAGRAWSIAALAVAAVLALALLTRLSLANETVVDLDVRLTSGQVTLTEPFEVRGGGPQAVRIEASAAVEQAWVGLDLALIDDQTGESDLVGFELSHYSGRDEDGAWSEGTRSGSAVAGSVRPGRYVLRVEPVHEQVAASGLGSGVPPSARVRVTRGVFLTAPLLLALGLLVAWPILASVKVALFERARWDESDHPWGSGDSGGSRGSGAAGAEDDA